MKRSAKIFVAMLLTLVLVCSMLAAVACKKDDPATTDECKDGHTLVAVQKKNATCKEAGYEAYWKCSVCNKLFSDAEGTTEITAPKTIAKTNDHKYTEGVYESDATQHWQVCTVCQTAGAKENHGAANAEGKCPTCGRDLSGEPGPEPVPGKVHVYFYIDGAEEAAETLEVDTNSTVESAYSAPAKGTGWNFDGWYTDDAYTQKATFPYEVAEADVNFYARYTRTNGVWVGDTFKHELVKNTGVTPSGDLVAEYWMGNGVSITLAVDDVITIYWNNAVLQVFIQGSSSGIQKPASLDNKVSSVTVSVAGDFQIYLKDYSSSTKPNNWVCEYAGPSEVHQGSEIPEGCDPVSITFGSNAPITLYLKDSTGAAVGEADFSKICIYTFSDEAFGGWTSTNTTAGLLKSQMTGSTRSVPSGWIFRWGTGYNTQTSNINNLFKAGKTYLVELPKVGGGDATVTELNLG